MLKPKRNLTIASVVCILLIMIMTIAGFTTACMPSATESRVSFQDETTNKNININNDEYNSDETTEILEALERHIKEDYYIDDGKLNLRIDALVSASETKKYSPVKVDVGFNQADADMFREYFTKDQVLYCRREKTKAEYEEEIERIVAVIKSMGGNPNDEYIINAENKDDDSINELIGYIDILEMEKRNAPSEFKRTVSNDFDIYTDDPYGALAFSEDEKTSIDISPSYFSYSKMQSSRLGQDLNSGIEVDILNCPEIAVADILLDDMKIKGFYAYRAMETELFDVAYNDFSPNKSLDYKGVEILYKRDCDGLSQKYFDSSTTREDEKIDYYPKQDAEFISVTVAENGEVVGFIWKNPVKILGEMEEKELLPYEIILEKFEETVAYEMSLYNGSRSIVSINDISLNVCVLPINEDETEYALVPCWYFSGLGYGDFTVGIHAIDGKSVSETASRWQEIG